MEQLGQKRSSDALGCGFFFAEQKLCGSRHARCGASEDAAENARESRRGKAAEIFHEARTRTPLTTTFCRSGLGKFRQAAPAMVAKSVTAVAIAKSRRLLLHLNPHQRSIEIMAWTKMKTMVVVGVV